MLSFRGGPIYEKFYLLPEPALHIIFLWILSLASLIIPMSGYSQANKDLSRTLPDTIKPVQKDSVELIQDFVPIQDRWRDIKIPPYELYDEGHWYDPYNQNILKGDYPIIGQHTFLRLTAVADNFVEGTRAPTPSGVSSFDPVNEPFFGRGERFFVNENLKLSFELYGGDAAYKPRDWELKVTSVFNLNYTRLRENNGVNINVRKGKDRTETHIAFQELFVEKHLFNVSDRYDFVSVKAGIQRFGSDFRSFVFNDFNLGARLFGNFSSNRIQYNIIYLPMLEKETNSELNTVFDKRDQDIVIANLYVQDFLTLGYTTQVSFLYNHDKSSVHYNENGFPVRPSVAGNVKPHEIKAYYAGWTGDGHIGALNITHAFYQVFGDDDFNSFAGRSITLNAQMAALELSVDEDWMRFRVSGFYASGDDNTSDNVGKGFDAILDEPVFAGGSFSYWNSQDIGLQGVGLVQKASLLPTLRSSKLEGQSNFVNPGIWIANVGYDAEISPKLKLTLNANYLRFVTTKVLQDFINQPALHRQIGIDYGLGLRYRPFLNNNANIIIGATALTPLEGFRDIYESSQTLFSFSTSVVFTY